MKEEVCSEYNLEAQLEAGNGNSVLFKQFLEKRIKNYERYVFFNPGDVGLAKEQDELKKELEHPEAWHTYCMKKSRENHEQSQEYMKINKQTLG